MENTAAGLEIIIYLQDGNVLKFEQGDDYFARKMMDQLHPHQLFNQQHIIIAGTYSLTAYRTAAITRIEFRTSLEPPTPWPFPKLVLNINEIIEDQFPREFEPEDAGQMRRTQQRSLWEPFTQYCEVELTSGERIYLAIRMQETIEIEQRHFIPHMMGVTLHAKARAGGVVIVNPAHIVRMTFTPGTREIPLNAWTAHRLSVNDELDREAGRLVEDEETNEKL